MTNSLKLGTIFGIQIEIHYSWLLIFGLLTWTLAAGYFPNDFSDWPTVQYWVVGAFTAILFFVSVLLHELGHSVVALYHKVPVRRITLFVFGGAAQIDEQPPSARAEFLIAVAGPLVSIVLGSTLVLTQLILPEESIGIGIARYLAFINLALAFFNMIPGFPLDGGRILRSAIWYSTDNLHRATVIAGNVGRFVGYAFMGLGILELLLGFVGSGLWIAFIGWFLSQAAMAEITQYKAREMLTDSTVSEIMEQNPPVVAGDMTLEEIINTHVLPKHQRLFVVSEDNQNVGLLTFAQIKSLSQEQRQSAQARDVMITFDDMQQVETDTELWDAFKLMQRHNMNHLPVKDNERLIGLVRRADIIEFIQMRRELSLQEQ